MYLKKRSVEKPLTLLLVSCLLLVFTVSPVFGEEAVAPASPGEATPAAIGIEPEDLASGEAISDNSASEQGIPVSEQDGVASGAAGLEPKSEEINELVEEGAVKSDEVILVMKDAVDEDRIVKDEDEILEVQSLSDRDKMVVVETVTDVGSAVAEYASDPNVEYAQPNYIYTLLEDANPETAGSVSPLADTNDPQLGNQWALAQTSLTRINKAWEITPTMNTKIRIAVIDTGVDVNHPDLKNNINTSLAYDTVSDSAIVTDIVGHGTHVAGIIGAETNNGIGVAGIAANRAEIVPYKIFYFKYNDETKKDDCISDTLEITEAYNKALDAGCKIVNLSLGGYEEQTSEDRVLESKIRIASNQGIITVAAAGNDNTSKFCYPSDWESVISVVATTSANTRWQDSSSSGSDHNRYKDISAPGAYIASTNTGTGYAYRTGTSMASPHIAGVVALMLSAHPDLTVAEIRQILYGTAKDLGTSGRDDYYGHGLVNAEEAVSAALALRDAQPISVIAELNGNQTAITVDARRVNKIPGVRQVRFAVWGNANGQNDLKWYTASNLGNGGYQASIPVSNHKETGIYTIHAYATLADGSSQIVGGTTVTLNPPKGTLRIQNVNTTAGTFQVRLSDINSGVSEVQIPVWCAADQSDILWYKATKQPDDSYVAYANIVNHKYRYGTYTAHCYVRSSNGIYSIAGGTTASISAPAATVTATLNAAQTQISMSASNVALLPGISKVQFAVWGNANGQNDLKWYTATKTGTNTYQLTAPVSNHKETGVYNIHVYATLTNGASVVIGGRTVTVSSPSGTATIQNMNTAAGTFQVRLSNIGSLSGISEVQIPVWCAADQSDILWYKAARQSDGSYIANVNIANHKYHYGTYTAHCYVRGGNGIYTAVAGKTVPVSAPTASVTATLDAAQTQISISASNVALLPGISKVQFAVWGNANGQNDLKWYTATKTGTNTYQLAVPVSNHKETGVYNIHVYATLTNGASVIVGGRTVTVN